MYFEIQDSPGKKILVVLPGISTTTLVDYCTIRSMVPSRDYLVVVLIFLEFNIRPSSTGTRVVLNFLLATHIPYLVQPTSTRYHHNEIATHIP